ncbi:MAG: alpha/beta fold hydrolase [Acidimicrobiales bacterium]
MLQGFGATGLYGARYGKKVPWVLALHGWRRDHRDFVATLTEPDVLDSIAVDLPGFGATPEPEVAYGSVEYARALLGLLEEMADDVVVLGHSFGGRVAVQLAALAPVQVSGLVLSGVPWFRPPGARSRPTARYRLARRAARLGLLSEETLEAYRQRYGSADYRASSGVMREILVKLLAEEYEEPLRAIACPVELVWGEDDSEAPLATAEAAKSLLGTAAALRVLPRAGHLVPLSAPAELRGALLRLGPVRRPAP